MEDGKGPGWGRQGDAYAPLPFDLTNLTDSEDNISQSQYSADPYDFELPDSQEHARPPNGKSKPMGKLGDNSSDKVRAAIRPPLQARGQEGAAKRPCPAAVARKRAGTTQAEGKVVRSADGLAQPSAVLRRGAKQQKKATAAKSKFLQSATGTPSTTLTMAPMQPIELTPMKPVDAPRNDILSPTALMRMVYQQRTASAHVPQAAPATSIMEAQERGEELQAVDDASYALDGLLGSHGGVNIRQDSAATLAALCTSRRGLGALMAEGMVPEVLSSLEVCLCSKDVVVALSGAAVLLGAAQPKADPSILRMPEALSLAKAILAQEAFLSPAESKGAPMQKLKRMLTEGPLSRQLPAAFALVPSAVVLASLSTSTDPHNEHRPADDALKEALNQSGLLKKLAELSMVMASAAPLLRGTGISGSSKKSGQISLWALQHCMQVMEHVTFCCMENVKYLGALEVPDPAWGSHSRPTACRFAEAAVHVMQRLSGLVKERKADVQPSLRASLAVLMNLTHSNPGGAQLVSDCGLCESTADLLEMVCRPNGKGSIDPGIERQRLVEAMEVLSISLGLLINLVEGQPANKPRLAKWHGGVLELLADVITLTGKHDAKVPEADRIGNEVTADDLDVDEAEGEASIVEVYAAMLLGFLIEEDSSLRQQAASLLPGGTLEPIVAAVEKCLEFYVRADAITDSSSTKLKNLVASLRRNL